MGREIDIRRRKCVFESNTCNSFVFSWFSCINFNWNHDVGWTENPTTSELPDELGSVTNAHCGNAKEIQVTALCKIRHGQLSHYSNLEATAICTNFEVVPSS